MKTSMTLQDLAATVQQQQQQAMDYVADTRNIHPVVFTAADGRPYLQLEVGGTLVRRKYGITDHAHSQLAKHIGIPAPYYHRLKSETTLWQQNVAHWFRHTPSERMVRTLDGTCRAFLSNRYRRMDNAQLCETVLPLLAETEIEVVSCNVSESYLHLKAVTPHITGEVRAGDVVQSGICIRNSEIGLSRLVVAPFLVRLVCTNGMTVEDYGVSKVHSGKQQEIDALLSDETRQAEDAVVWMKVRDAVKACSEPEIFGKLIEKLAATLDTSLDHPPAVTQVLQKAYAIREDEAESVLEHLITGGDLNQFGLIQAVSRMSQEIEDYDRASAVERTAGKLLALEPPAFRQQFNPTDLMAKD